MRKPRLVTEHGLPESLSNLYYGNESSVIEIKDAVEDSNTAAELAKKLNRLNLLRTFTVDRETEEYARLQTVDAFGNKSYLKAFK